MAYTYKAFLPLVLADKKKARIRDVTPNGFNLSNGPRPSREEWENKRAEMLHAVEFEEYVDKFYTESDAITQRLSYWIAVTVLVAAAAVLLSLFIPILLLALLAFIGKNVDAFLGIALYSLVGIIAYLIIIL